MFITANDYAPYIKESNLQRMIGDDIDTSVALGEAQATALAIVKNSLFSRYDTNVIFAQEGDARNKVIVRYVVVLTLYYLYERLPANIMPERVQNNYTEVMDALREIEDGKKPIDLPQRTNEETGLPVTKFRFSLNPPRTHNY